MLSLCLLLSVLQLTGFVAKYDLSRTTCGCLTANARRNLLNLSACFKKSVDVLHQICAIANRRSLLGFIRH